MRVMLIQRREKGVLIESDVEEIQTAIDNQYTIVEEAEITEE